MAGTPIGIDLDNTIIRYDRVFAVGAQRLGLTDLTPSASKTDIREAVRRLPDGETQWQRLQGWGYGAGMPHACLFDGVRDFLAACARHGRPVVVVSHKTQYGHFDPEQIDLREAALSFLQSQGLIAPAEGGIPRASIFFEATRSDKVARIASLGCSDFIDDLEEVFLDPGFPAAVRRHLFAAGHTRLPAGPFAAYACWEEITRALFAE